MYLVSVIFIDSVFRTGKNYPQVFLEECKQVAEKQKIPKYITNVIEISSDDSDKKDSDKEYSERDSDEEDFNEKKEEKQMRTILKIFFFEGEIFLRSFDI